MPKVYAITGANRGLGLEFVRQISQDPGNIIIGAVRSLSGELDDLKRLCSGNSQIHMLECDTSSVDSVQSFGKELTRVIGRDGKLDYLVNNAGINAVPHMTALALDPAEVRQHIDINVIGPAETVKAVSSHLQEGSVVLNMSSGLGSCGRGVVRGAAYGISKAALNMLTVHQAQEMKGHGVTVICMDPGWVQTRMGGKQALLVAEESVGGMLKVMRGLSAQDSGKFFRYDGGTTPW